MSLLLSQVGGAPSAAFVPLGVPRVSRHGYSRGRSGSVAGLPWPVEAAPAAGPVFGASRVPRRTAFAAVRGRVWCPPHLQEVGGSFVFVPEVHHQITRRLFSPLFRGRGTENPIPLGSFYTPQVCRRKNAAAVAARRRTSTNPPYTFIAAPSWVPTVATRPNFRVPHRRGTATTTYPPTNAPVTLVRGSATGTLRTTPDTNPGYRVVSDAVGVGRRLATSGHATRPDASVTGADRPQGGATPSAAS